MNGDSASTIDIDKAVTRTPVRRIVRSALDRLWLRQSQPRRYRFLEDSCMARTLNRL